MAGGKNAVSLKPQPEDTNGFCAPSGLFRPLAM